MNTLQSSIIIIALCASIACALPGTFLMLRGIALLSDAISHAILPGIVIMALLIQNLKSPLLIIGASLAGIVTVIATETIIQSKRLKKDAAIGLVFPVFFSIGVVLISLYARTIHLDLDMVLLGELAFAPFNRLIMFNTDVGPYALWIMAAILLINILFVALWYKELMITTFDATLAHTLGFTPTIMYYGLIIITSITAVATLNVVGSTIIVALMLTAPATAYLLTHRLSSLISISICCSIASAVSGYTVAGIGNLSIAGSIACMSGILFATAFIFAPYKGLCAQLLFHYTQRRSLACSLVCAVLAEHPATIPLLATHLNWSERYTKIIVALALKRGYVMRMHDTYRVTPQGSELEHI